MLTLYTLKFIALGKIIYFDFTLVMSTLKNDEILFINISKMRS